MEVTVNLWAVLAAMASSLVVGSIWYARPVFGNTWMRLAKIDPSKDGGSVFKPIGIKNRPKMRFYVLNTQKIDL